MNALVSLQEARDHLRIDFYPDSDAPDMNDGTEDLALKIYAASAMVLNYLGDSASSFLDSGGQVEQDSAGNPIVPFEVKAATLMMLGYLWRLRDGDPDKAYEHGYLPMPVISMLYPLRDPALS
jgi:hypothetical protein